jgi:hypothetical protein
MKPSKAVIAGAAVAGLLTGSFAVRAYAASTSVHAGVSLQTVADAEKALPKHACKGQNECKGQGGARAVAAQAKTPAKVREVAQPTEASRLPPCSNRAPGARLGERLRAIL